MSTIIDLPGSLRHGWRLDRLVTDALAAGARSIVRGGPVTHGPLARGAFYRPTFLEVADPGLSIVQEEVFGPVVTLQVFDTEAEAVAWRMTPSTGWPRASGRGTPIARFASRATSRRVRCG